MTANICDIVYFMVLSYYMTQQMMQDLLCERVKIMVISRCVKVCKLEFCIIYLYGDVCLCVCVFVCLRCCTN